MKYFAVVAYSLRDLVCCVIRDALLHTTVIMCGYLHYCHLPVNQSGPSPLTSLTIFLPAPFFANSRDCCV